MKLCCCRCWSHMLAAAGCWPQCVLKNEWKKSEFCSTTSMLATTPHFLPRQQFGIIRGICGKMDALVKIAGYWCKPVAAEAGFDFWWCAHAMLLQQLLAILMEETRSEKTTPLCCNLMNQNSKNPSCRWVFTRDVSLPPSPALFCGLWIAAPACFSCCD